MEVYYYCCQCSVLFSFPLSLVLESCSPLGPCAFNFSREKSEIQRQRFHTDDVGAQKSVVSVIGLKALVNEDTLLPMMLTGKHLLRTQNVSEQNQKHFLCPGHKICVRNKCCARWQTGKHLCRQHVRNNVSSFARAFTCAGKFPTQVAAHQSEPGKTGHASVCSYLRFYR